MRKLFMLIFLVVLGLVLGDIPCVCAQGSDVDEFTLEEITVTAQKREENQQKVPIAMEVITAEEIRDFGKNDLDEILSTVSSAIIQKAQDGLRISIRGVNDYTDAGSGQVSATPTVAVNIDGVTSNRKDTGSGLFDLERVEVLYGPQSTLYATQSPGGIVNVITASPKLDTYEVSGTLEYGNYNLLHTDGVMNAPLGDKTAIRAAFTTSVRDGYLSNGGDNEDSKSARIRALFQPNDRLSFLATAEFSKDGGSGYSGGVTPFINESDVPNPWTGADVGSLGVNDQERRKVFVNIDWDMGFGVLTLLPSYFTGEGYREMKEMTPAGLEEKTMWQKHRDELLEVHMNSSPDSSIEWIIGFIHYDAMDRNRDLSQEYIDTGVGQWRMRDMVEEQRALFGNIKYPVTEQFRLSAGARKSDDSYFMIQEGMMMFPWAPGTYSHMLTVQLMENPDKPELNFGFEYDYGENTMVYGGYSTAYRLQGQYRSLTKPEKLKSYTLGAKNRFFGNKLQLNISAYYYDYKNFLARQMASAWLLDLDGDMEMDRDEQFDDSGAAGQGDGRMIGLDIQTSAIITEKDRLDLSISYIESEWTNLFFDFDYNQTLEYDEETDSLIWVDVPDQSYNGKPMTLTPPWTVNLIYSHNFDLANGGVISARFESRYQSEYRLTWKEAEYPYNNQEAHHLENASMTYTDPNGKWTLTGYIRNIFEYAEKRAYRSDQGFLSIGAPRTYGAVISVRY